VEVLELVAGLDVRVGVDTRSLAALATIRDLRGARYDAAIDLQGLLKSALLARAAGADRTIGFARAHLREPLARFFYSHTPDTTATHVVFKNLALLEPLGVRDPRVEFPLDIPRTSAAEQITAEAGAPGYALINPGAAWPNKRWPPERFGALAATMRERFGMRSVVLWGPGEESLAAAVVAASKDAARLAPRTTVTDLFSLAKGARLMVSGDTGPLHIAGAVGTPTVSLFGPTNPERNGPWSPADVAMSRFGGCSCHYQRRCRRGDPCINEIAVGDVVAAVERRARG
jgi:ADP-heptose:LPS heptosyltransferase